MLDLLKAANSFQRKSIRKVVILMPGVKVRDNESFEQALRRFKKQCEKAGILSELRKREFYEKPSIRRKKKQAAADKKRRKTFR